MSMDKKSIVVVVLGVAAIAMFYYAYTTMEVEDSLTFLRQRLNASEFNKDFLKRNCSVIVMDLREVEDPYRKNIVMCGIELAKSMGLMGRETQVMSFDENGCVEEESGNKTVRECRDMLKKECYIFYIKKGQNTSSVYEGLLIIEEGNEYFPCVISVS